MPKRVHRGREGSARRAEGKLPPLQGGAVRPHPPKGGGQEDPTRTTPARTAATPRVASLLYHSPERPVHGQGTFEWAASGCV